MVSIKASQDGLDRIDKLRMKKHWSKTEDAWYGLAGVSRTTLGRFWRKSKIHKDNFSSIEKYMNG